ncbi:MAG: pilus assembly protein MshP [Pseudomonadota bacterium]
MSHSASHGAQAGFSLVTAIFIVVVLAALGTFMVTISGLQQTSSALDVVGARAYQAARSGIEWGAFQTLQNASGVYATNCRAATYAAPTSSVIAFTGTLAGFSASVSCGSTSAVEGATTIWLYQLISTARHGVPATPDYVERRISATIAR